MIRVLVAGGKGFIGSHFVNYLKGRDFWVRNVDVKAESFLRTEEDEFLCLDLRKYSNALKSVEGVDWVFNFAANMGGIGFITKVKADVMRDNVRINANMLEASTQAKVKRFFYASSACIYPEYAQETSKATALREQDAFPAYPDSAYGWEKLFTEKLCKAYREDYGLTVRVARYHNVYGPYGTFEGGREKAPAALCRKVALASNQDVIEVWGDGKQTRSFLFVDDCVEATFLLMKSDFPLPLNIGSSRLVTVDELADIIIGFSGKQLGKRHDLSKAQGVRGRNADLRLTREAIGWRPKTSLEEGLEKTYRWIEKQVNECA